MTWSFVTSLDMSVVIKRAASFFSTNYHSGWKESHHYNYQSGLQQMEEIDKVLVAAMVDKFSHKTFFINMTGQPFRVKETQNLVHSVD